ncbi:dehydrin COR410-like [Phragmites australis]|uniref:dehydrin COR410-like n=1 Tax=Phragmites australis TaxID=29695 RepID=UPI002D78664B|nr:dehydrin COR410-like [Phragmites australis]
MEDERNTQYHQGGEAQEKAADQVEVKDRGLFDTLLGRKKPEDQEKKQEELVTGMEKVTVAEPEKPEVKKEEHEAGEKKESLLAKLHRTSSSSSSSSDEEEEVIDENGEVVKRKKKGLKEKIQERLPGHKDHDQEGEHKTTVPAPAPAPVETHVYKEDDDHKAYKPAPAPAPAATHVHQHDNAVVVQKIEDDVKTEEEKKGLLDKIKERLPGGHKKPEDAAAPAAHAPSPHTEDVSSPDGKEKKGLLGKIMDKIPGYNKGAPEEDHKAAAAGEHKTSS